MSENSLTEGDSPPSEVAIKNEVQDEAAVKPLKMSFADWKKCKEAETNNNNNETDCDAAETTTSIGRNERQHQQQHKHDNNNKQHSFNGNGNRNSNNHHNNNNNGYAPLNRPPPLPFPLMSMGFGNFGPCGPPSMMPPQHGNNMGGMGCMGGGRNNQRTMQTPPFWQDMMSPQHRSPPIQPPMPKCPSLWNLVPKDKGNNNRNNKSNGKQNQQQNQPNKKYKAHNNPNNTSKDAALMPPPPAPGAIAAAATVGGGVGNSNNSSNATPKQGAVVKKKKNGGTFVQIDGKWIQRPEAPPPLEEAPPGTKEDRQRQWREYRQAMKPFKNREFHNWKRTVQRLSKLPRNELDERQLERLQKAEEYIGAHKAMLTVKHAEHWVQQNTQKPDAAGGQVYVRKQAFSSWERKDCQNTFQRGPLPSMRKPQIFGTGRAIKGGIGAELTPAAQQSVCGVLTAPPPPPPIGQFPDLTAGYFGQSQGYNSSSIYGDQDVAASSSNNGSSSSSSNPFYASYNTNFVKGGTLLPP